MIAFLAIDPGTYKTGAAYFDGARLVDYWLIEVPQKMEIEDRIPALVDAIEALAQLHPKIQGIACERMTALSGRPPPPELATFVRRLRRWATKRFGVGGWDAYHPSTVLASVRPRAMFKKSTKDVLRAGVEFIYDEYGNRELFNLDQNVIDAIAVGHCHIGKTRERELFNASV